MSSEQRRSFKDRAKERLGIGVRNKSKSEDVRTQIAESAKAESQSAVDSHSYTHGHINPLSWDNLPSSIRDTLEGDVGTRENNTDNYGPLVDKVAEKKKATRQVTRPKGVVDYKVSCSDTLANIAARFDTTTSELTKLNKLANHMIFPGQMLFVPDKEYVSSSDSSPSRSPKDTKDMDAELEAALKASVNEPAPAPAPKPFDVPMVRQAERTGPRIPRGPGHAERQRTEVEPDNPRPLSDDEVQKLDQECYERFIKVSVKHITDGQGVVSGVLLVTPNAIMFDPNVSDPLVIEHGADKYGMIAPMETIISAAMYHDIAAMRLKGAPKDEQPDTPRPEVYHAKDCPMYHVGGQPEPAEAPSEETKEEVDAQLESPETPGSREKVPLSMLRQESTCSCGALELDTDAKFKFDSQLTDALVEDEVEERDSVHRQKNSSQTAQDSSAYVTGASVATKDNLSGTSQQPDDFFSISPRERVEFQVGSLSSTEGDFMKPELITDLTKVDVIPEKKHQRENPPDVVAGHAGSAEKDQQANIVVESGKISAKDTGNVANLSDTTSSQKEDSTEKTLNGHSDSREPDVAYDLIQFDDSQKSAKGATETSSVNSGPATEDQCAQDASDGATAVEGDKVGPGSPASNLTPHMQIGNIRYFHYGSTDQPNMEPPGGAAAESEKGISSPKTPSFTKMAGGDSGAASADPQESVPPVGEMASNASGKSSPISVPKSEASAPQGIFSRTISSLSSFGSLTGSPNFSTLVDFSSGLFTRNTEERGKVKDITEVDTTAPPGTTVWYTGGSAALEEGAAQEIEQPDGQTESRQSVEVVSAVKLNDRPDLFQSLDELIPKPARHYDDPPLYLCLKVGTPINKRVSKTCPIESYMKKRKQPEYWFSIPRDKVDHLYAFFIQWSPNIYGDEASIDPKERGFVVINDSDAENEEVTEENMLDVVEDHFTSEHRRLHRQMTKDWEIVNVEEIRRRMSSLDTDSIPQAELLDPSTVMQEEHILELSRNLPARAEGYPWKLMYSTDRHGFSLKTFYHKAQELLDAPTLIVVKDSRDQVFGAMLSCAPRRSDHFYGSGKSFLFTFYPEFKRYNWTGENNFFVKGNAESFSVGAGEGSFGLWLDGDIYHGRTAHCKTYNNPVLAETEDFVVKGLEAWVFV